MSKVEVRKTFTPRVGDRWFVYCSGGLILVRDGKYGLINYTDDKSLICNPAHSHREWCDFYEPSIGVYYKPISEERAFLWMRGMGYEIGTVVEEREEAVPSTLTVKIYRSTHDGSLWMIDSPTHAAPSGYAFIGTTTIHIAGVTA